MNKLFKVLASLFGKKEEGSEDPLQYAQNFLESKKFRLVPGATFSLIKKYEIGQDGVADFWGDYEVKVATLSGTFQFDVDPEGIVVDRWVTTIFHRQFAIVYLNDQEEYYVYEK